MKQVKKVEKVKGRQGKRKAPHGGRRQKSCRPRSFELRLKAVKLYLEEGFSAELVADEIGIGKAIIYEWARK